MANTMRKNTDDGTRGGAVRSSDEVFVMKTERRGCVTPLTNVTNLPCGDE